MCLCLFAIRAHEEYPLVVLANRDEFRARPSAQADYWKDRPNILAGRDLQQMGTWLGVSRVGKIAFLTNYRDPASTRPDAPSRGDLVSGFLSSESSGEEHITSIANPEAYNGFNLVVGNTDRLVYFSNVNKQSLVIPDGVHGLSNALLNSSWPKVDSGKEALIQALNRGELKTDHLFDIIQNSKEAQNEQLPETGVGLELERKLSSRFINLLTYGTVCSTVILVNRKGECTFEEKTYDQQGQQSDSKRYQLKFVPSFRSR